MSEETTFPTLVNSPIILAILEIKFSCASSVTNASLQSLKKLLKHKFPIYTAAQSVDIHFQPQIPKTPISLKGVNLTGHSFFSESKQHEVFVSNDTFTFKQHGKYSDWKDFKTIALDAWQICSDEIKPIKTSRLSIRYINSIFLPILEAEPIVQQKDLFQTFIAYTGPIVKPMSNYFLRYTHPNDENNVTVNFTQELKNGDGKTLPFIIDIDILYMHEENFSFEFIKSKFNELREIKNKYFFSNLTPRTLSLIA